MTSLSSISSVSLPSSPRTQMNSRIAAAVSAGSISATDQTALGSALDSIDSALGSSKPAGSGGSVKDRIDSLIDNQVTAGTLTDAQAEALKGFFGQNGPPSATSTDATSSDTSTIDAASSVGGPCGPGGPGGPPPPPPSGDSDDSSTTTSSDTTVDAMLALLEQLRAGLTANTSSYNATSTGTASTGLVFNSLA